MAKNFTNPWGKGGKYWAPKWEGGHSSETTTSANYIGGSPQKAMQGEQGKSSKTEKPTGVYPNEEAESNKQLLANLLDALTDFTLGSFDNVAHQLVAHLSENTGSDFYSPVLSKAVAGEEEYEDLADEIRKQFKDQMVENKENVSKLNIQISKLPDFGISDPELHSLIGGTQQLDIYLKNISINGNNYTADLQINLIDTFGVDKKGTGGFIEGEGLRSFYVLQHERGYKPFRNVMKFNMTIKGSF